ncbi:MAG TPA: PP2C family protein-serine/threonine phosphatase [Candidatus Rifleibacterium sp.]|nr:PP2C family protein-serine/threonine phosphatase [Candidatus Rifleibacterium sp.]
MADNNQGSSHPPKAMSFYLLWLLGIAILAALGRESDLALLAVFVLLGIFFLSIRRHLQQRDLLQEVCNFYEQAHALDDMQLLQSERPFSRILQTVIELGRFDWAVLFLMDFEKDVFMAVEAAGIGLEHFKPVDFDDISTDHASDSMKLSLKLLEYAFKTYEFKGALAGSALERNNIFYGCLLVGRHAHDAELSSEDSFRLDILSDQISICLHNYRLHKELGFHAEELARRQAQIQRELEMARIVQDGAMPRQKIRVPGLEVASYLKPARFIGGDFLRYIEGDNPDILGILIGDVCGKGVPAALVMAVVVCLFNERTALEIEPGALMGRVNIALKEFLGAGSRFNSTALWGVFNLETMKFNYCSAGHDFPLHYSSSSATLTELPSTGTLLGIFNESIYGNSEIDVADGDKILFYSDGLVDFFEAWANCEDGYLYLKDFFIARAAKLPEEIVKEIAQMVENSPAAVKDDITVAVFDIDRKRRA